MSNTKFDIQALKDVFEQEIRPAVQSDGGDVEFIDFKDGVVTLKMSGACVGCAMSSYTLKLGIENRLQQYFPEINEVIAID